MRPHLYAARHAALPHLHKPVLSRYSANLVPSSKSPRRISTAHVAIVIVDACNCESKPILRKQQQEQQQQQQQQQHEHEQQEQEYEEQHEKEKESR